MKPERQNVDAYRRILAVAKQLVRTSPMDEISVKEIISRAQISRATFYKYFTDKRALLTEIFQSELTRGNWFDYSVGWIERTTWFYEHLLLDRQFYLSALSTPEFEKAWKDLAFEANVALLETIAAAEEVSHDLLVRYARFVTPGLVETAIEWLRNPGNVTAADLAERQALFYEHGLRGIMQHVGPELMRQPAAR